MSELRPKDHQTQTQKKILFRDPIYNLIEFNSADDEIIMQIIASPEFQRLRRIKQLGLGHYTFPSGVHDRFTHSIGVAYLAGLMVDKLELPKEGPQKDGQTTVLVKYTPRETSQAKEEQSKIMLNKRQIKILVRIAAILHDIGHGPFSHAFERAFKPSNDQYLPALSQYSTHINNLFLVPKGDRSEKLQLHEAIGRKILLNSASKIYEILGLEGCQDEDLKAFKGHIRYLVDDILTGTIEPFWIREIISGQFDCDRIDFLLRDAYMCGVRYASFDWEWIFNHIELSDHLKSEDASHPFKYRLAINGEKGIYSLESFLIARYHMYEQVYGHKTTQHLETIITYIIKRVAFLWDKYRKDKKEKEFYEIVPFLDKAFIEFLSATGEDNMLNHYLRLDDTYMMTHFHFWATSSKDNILKELCSCVVNRKTFKQLETYSYDPCKVTAEQTGTAVLEEERRADEELNSKQKFLEGRLSRNSESTDEESRSFSELTDEESWSYFTIIQQQMSKAAYKTGDTSQIYIKNRDKKIQSIEEESPFIKDLKPKTDVYRVFYFTKCFTSKTGS